jgi:hypothetical protein
MATIDDLSDASSPSRPAAVSWVLMGRTILSPRRGFGPGAARLFSLLLRHRHSLRSHVHTCAPRLSAHLRKLRNF